MAIELIGEAVSSGARRFMACDVLDISIRTLQRWERSPGSGDRRAGPGSKPKNALSDAERALVVDVATSPKYRDLAPSQIVPRLADSEVYLASESSFYRILREKKMLEHRGRSKAPVHGRPREQEADGPNQLYSWDITFRAPGLQEQSETVRGA